MTAGKMKNKGKDPRTTSINPVQKVSVSNLSRFFINEN
jgi:hypothetical protein